MFGRSLRKALYDAVAKAAEEPKPGVAFSGGVDSALLAKICTDLGREVLLITAGFPYSHDLDFSKKIALKMGLAHKTVEIDSADFGRNVERVQHLIECGNTSHIENCVAYRYIAAASKQEGLQAVLSANGCDELFCGYNAYRLAYDEGPEALQRLMDEKIANELLLVQEISTVTREFDVTVRQPFLDAEFIHFAKSIPFGSKITGPQDMLRKHALRQVALELNVPEESAMKPKKALQYGSMIHKNLQNARKALRSNVD